MLLSDLEKLTLKYSKPIRVRTHRHKTLFLKRPSLGDDKAIRTALSETEARITVAHVLHHYLIRPELSLETVCAWPEKLLLRVARTWVRPALCDEQPCETLEEVCSRLSTYVREKRDMHRSMKALLDPFHGMESIIRGSLLSSSVTDILRPFDAIKSAALLSEQMFPSARLIPSIIEPLANYRHLVESMNSGLLASAVAQTSEAERMLRSIHSDVIAAQTLHLSHAERAMEQMRSDARAHTQKMLEEVTRLSRGWAQEEIQFLKGYKRFGTSSLPSLRHTFYLEYSSVSVSS